MKLIIDLFIDDLLLILKQNKIMTVAFNKNETKGVFKILISLMKVDGVIEKREIDYLSGLTATFGVDTTLLKDADLLDFDNAITILKNLNDDQKQIVMSLMLKMMDPKNSSNIKENKMYFDIITQANFKMPGL